jgi:L-rhamnose mutarotase
MIVAKRTVLLPRAELSYEAAHASPPAAVTDALRSVGVRSWRIWRSESDLFHTIDVEDRERMSALAASDPVLLAWNASMRGFLAPTREAHRADLPLVWSMT